MLYMIFTKPNGCQCIKNVNVILVACSLIFSVYFINFKKRTMIRFHFCLLYAGDSEARVKHEEFSADPLPSQICCVL